MQILIQLPPWDPVPESRLGSTMLYFALPSMGCKANKILLFLQKTKWAQSITPINLSSCSILKLKSMNKSNYVHHSIGQDQDPDPDPDSTFQPGSGSIINESRQGTLLLTTAIVKPNCCYYPYQIIFYRICRLYGTYGSAQGTKKYMDKNLIYFEPVREIEKRTSRSVLEYLSTHCHQFLFLKKFDKKNSGHQWVKRVQFLSAKLKERNHFQFTLLLIEPFS